MKKTNKLDSLILTAGRVVRSLQYQRRLWWKSPGSPPSRALSFNVLMSQSLESQLGNHITLDDSGPSVLASVGGTAASEVPPPM